MAISGASERVNYHVGLGYNQEKGIYVGDSRDQFSFKGSLDAQINKIISGGFTVNMAYIRNEYANDDAIELAYRLNPFCQPYSTQPDEKTDISMMPTETFRRKDTPATITTNTDKYIKTTIQATL